MMRDDLNVMEAVILDHITAILYVGQQSAGEGLSEEEAEACVEYFSPYIEWSEVAIKREFQALTLAKGHEEIQGYQAQSQKSLQGWGRLRIAKPPSPIPGKIHMGLNCSPQQFQQRVNDNWWAGYHSGKHHLNPELTPLDRNNSALSRQLPQQSRGDQRWGRVAYVVNGKVACDRPTHWQLVKFAVEKEAEINLDEAKKALKPKTTTHFHFDHKKLSLPANPAVQMVAPVPEEGAGEKEATSQPSEDSDSGESMRHNKTTCQSHLEMLK